MHFISSGVSNGVKKKKYVYICIYIYIYIYCDRAKNRETIPSSLQACFVITHSSSWWVSNHETGL